MKSLLKQVLVAVTLAAPLAALAAYPERTTSAAQPNERPYPSKPIRILVTTTPGSGGDLLARLVGHNITQAWGQQVVVDNRAGASGIIGAEIAKREEFRERMWELGTQPIGTTPQEFAAHIQAEVEKMRRALKVAGVRPDV